MIPKVIHYCWFGGNQLSEASLKCIHSWETFLPDYRIVRWDENNFDVNCCDYVKEAYQAKKWAFVSDYARFAILYQHGGLYFDTDVEVIRSMDEIISAGAFMGCENRADTSHDEKWSGEKLGVAPGLGLGVNPGLGLYREILDDYENSHFLTSDGSMDLINNVVMRTTTILVKHGLKNKDCVQQIAGINIYPKDYFSPKSLETLQIEITPHTYTIHHYDASWVEWYDKAADVRGRKLRKIFGNRLGNTINVVIYTFQKYGLMTTIKKITSRKEIH